MSTEDQQRFMTMAEDYDQIAPVLVPMYDWLQSEMLHLLQVDTMSAGSLLDLGAGSGIFLEKALARNSALHGVWIDSSPAFMAVAQRRLARFSDRVTYLVTPLEAEWETQLTAPVSAITSMSAIHHLEHEEKRALYQRCYDMLVPGGWLLNCDEMMTISYEAYVQSLYFWVHHVEKAAASLRPEQKNVYDKWCSRFARWKIRNIDNIKLPKQKGDDLHEPFIDQIQWLREIGFTDADLFVKYHLWCLIGGQKHE
ncbi:MAG: methyltransferase [bacterium]